MQLEDVAIAALLPPPAMPGSRPAECDLSIEIVREDDADDSEAFDDAAATTRFVRFSAPYERIELSEVAPLPQQRSRPTTFAKTLAKGTPSTGVPSLRTTVKMAAVVAPSVTVEMPAVTAPRPTIALPLAPPPSVTVPFERVWFDDEEPERLAAIEEPVVAPQTSWWWLAISLAAGAAAVAWMASLA
jgi:hypothetical protein